MGRGREDRASARAPNDPEDLCDNADRSAHRNTDASSVNPDALAAKGANGTSLGKRAALGAADVDENARIRRVRAQRMSLRVQPTLGASFGVLLAPDATVADLREAVWRHTGVDTECQLLGHARLDADALDAPETRLSSVLPLRGGTPTVSLAVRASTGVSGGASGLAMASASASIDVADAADLLAASEAAGATIFFQTPNGHGTAEIEIVSSGGVDSESDGDTQSDDSSSSPLRNVVDTIDSLRLSDGSLAEAVSRPASPVKEAPREEPKTRLVTDAGAGRCDQCGRRCRPALQFACRCGRTFCQEHRYYDRHGCPFDARARDRAILSAANPRVVRPQLDRI